jgi:hypothetical protein
LFDYDWLQNKYPVIGLIVWYAFIFILGLAVYPIIRLAMPGLGDKGYPLSRALGIVILGYFSWIGGSLGIPYTRTTITVVFGCILLMGAILGHLQRNELIEEWKTKRKYFLTIEGVFLAFFVIDLLIRIGNPDLWHPSSARAVCGDCRSSLRPPSLKFSSPEMPDGSRGSGSIERLCSVETSFIRSASLITPSVALRFTALATAASSSPCLQRPSATGSTGVTLAIFQWVRSRIDSIVGLVVPTSLPICPSVSSGWNLTSQAIAAGRSCRLLSGV